MTGAQASHLKMLADEVQEPAAFAENLSRREASRRIDVLAERLAPLQSAAAHGLERAPPMGFSRPENWWHSEGGGRLTRLIVASILLALGTLLLVDAGPAMALTLTSSAFAPGEKIPSGDDLSPPLAFAGVPDGTKSLALIVDDPDVPDPKAPKRVWVHWVVYNLPPDSQGLPEDANRTGLPKGAVAGLNDWKRTSYGGPCPPIGRHRYFHKLYALDITLPAKPLSKPDLEAAMKGHVLVQAEHIGTYQKGDP